MNTLGPENMNWPNWILKQSIEIILNWNGENETDNNIKCSEKNELLIKINLYFVCVCVCTACKSDTLVIIITALPMDFYDCICLIVNAVQRHRLHFLRIVVHDPSVRRCHFLGRATVHFPVNHLLAAIVLLAHHNLQSVGQRIEGIVDRTQAWPGNVANVDNRLDIANNDYMIFLMEHCHLHHHCRELEN